MTTPAGKMPLRDWLAGQALAGFCASLRGSGEFKALAADCYRIADAMIAHAYPPKKCRRFGCDEDATSNGVDCDQHKEF